MIFALSSSISIPYGSIKRLFWDSTLPMPAIISIPYGSIKSLRRLRIVLACALFQFLMVRLKDDRLQPTRTGDTFQFLMVRLKVAEGVGSLRHMVFQFLMVRLKAIASGGRASIARFQFLMVRLKGWPLVPVLHYSHISIPYGSIKSSPELNMERLRAAFQFLMVRLKAVVLTQVTRLMFRLITDANGTAKVQKKRRCEIK